MQNQESGKRFRTLQYTISKTFFRRLRDHQNCIFATIRTSDKLGSLKTFVVLVLEQRNHNLWFHNSVLWVVSPISFLLAASAHFLIWLNFLNLTTSLGITLLVTSGNISSIMATLQSRKDRRPGTFGWCWPRSGPRCRSSWRRRGRGWRSRRRPPPSTGAPGPGSAPSSTKIFHCKYKQS